MSIVNAFLGCIGGFVLVGVNLLALALVFKGSAIAFLFLLFEVFGVTLGWKAIQALVRETCRPKPPPGDLNLPTFSEFHKQWKKDHPEESGSGEPTSPSGSTSETEGSRPRLQTPGTRWWC
ncbi:hypothetical protein [Methanocorpusculum sp. GPch4]|jgi:hypothetical protein|uniref:hypothetical protein n=1 Tax=Methanocorpusculum sp. GPch4 TaxID=2527877 RepID=UPI001432C4A2|nr:hypothetical protein [Methanocorpusculum sp. GPch4]